MRDWKLTPQDPLALRLAADARLQPTDYADDHIWELTLAGGEPSALTLRTTYGLRARDMRLFPTFGENDRFVTDPAEFSTPPLVRAVYVNYLRLSFSPLPDLVVTAHYWVPDSHSIAGRFTLVNYSTQPRRIQVQLSALLRPLDNPRPMGATKIESYTALEGYTGNLAVVVALEGKAQLASAPYPTLALEVELTPEQPAFVRWVEAARPQMEAGVELIRNLFEREWDGEFARIELLNSGSLDIETGDPDWDAAFAF